jgi:catechol 2,3-dioxygenase
MFLPATNHTPPFNVTRASHVALGVTDLSRSLAFYEEVVGLVVTAREEKRAFLRGVEEDAHHSLILAEGAEPACDQLGFRVFADEDLDRAAAWLEAAGLKPRFAEVPFQKRTLRFRDPQGIAIELVSSMPTLPRLHSRADLHKGGAALRFDHSQNLVPDVAKAAEFYATIGFRISDYSFTPKGEIVAAFMHRKNNPHDIVLASRQGPRLHHFGYIVEASSLMRVGDVAASLGMGRQVEYGPSRHGQDHASFVYLRDPDGHRIELLAHPVQIIDLDSAPIGRDVTDRRQFVAWGQATPATFLAEATRYRGEPQVDAVVPRTW